jgi:hypothetical protein
MKVQSVYTGIPSRKSAGMRLWEHGKEGSGLERGGQFDCYLIVSFWRRTRPNGG